MIAKQIKKYLRSNDINFNELLPRKASKEIASKSRRTKPDKGKGLNEAYTRSVLRGDDYNEDAINEVFEIAQKNYEYLMKIKNDIQEIKAAYKKKVA